MTPSLTIDHQDGLWIRLIKFAWAEKLSYGIGVDHVSGRIVAHVGRAMAGGHTSNEAINGCADQLAALHGWEDDRR